MKDYIKLPNEKQFESSEEKYNRDSQTMDRVRMSHLAGVKTTFLSFVV